MFDSDSLPAWMTHMMTLHAARTHYGLANMQAMLEILAPDFSDATVITVGGTNGKGSSCTMLERIYREAGYKTGLHVSPHLLRVNERCRVNGQCAGDDDWVWALRAVEAARGDRILTFFEFTALAALMIFARARVQVVILEIGLGGRLDAINAVPSDAALISTVAIDHVALLGSDREHIAAEKAAIYRPGAPAVFSQPDRPAAIDAAVAAAGARGIFAGRDYRVTPAENGGFDYADARVHWTGLPAPALRGRHQIQNAGGVLAVVSALLAQRPVTGKALAAGIARATIHGRYETVTTDPVPTIVDVGHNPEAALSLAENIRQDKQPGEITIAVFGMLADKDMAGVCRAVKPVFDRWYVANPGGERGASQDALAAHLAAAGVPAGRIHTYAGVPQALAAARACADEITQGHPRSHANGKQAVRIVIFGSFVTVTAALACVGNVPNALSGAQR